MNRLVDLALVSLVTSAAIGVVTMGFAFPTLFALLHAPTVLLALLLVRAAVLAWRRQSLALRWRGRSVLGGAAGLWLPAVALLAWTVLRESGRFEINACKQVSSQSSQRLTMPWKDRVDEPLLAEQGIRVRAPDNTFGRSIDKQVTDQWIYGQRAVHAEIVVDATTPWAPWPLYKTTALRYVVRGVVQLHAGSSQARGPVRCSSFELVIEQSFATAGFASHRKHREWIGQCIGAEITECLQKLVRLEPQ